MALNIPAPVSDYVEFSAHTLILLPFPVSLFSTRFVRRQHLWHNLLMGTLAS